MMANPFLPARPRMRLIGVGSQRQHKHVINKMAQKILKTRKSQGVKVNHIFPSYDSIGRRE